MAKLQNDSTEYNSIDKTSGYIRNKSNLSFNLNILGNYLLDLAQRSREVRLVDASDKNSVASSDLSLTRDALSDGVFHRLADTAYRDRRVRDALFEGLDLFGEPAWDILLDLLRADKSGKRVSVTSACIAAAVPSSTALRWIGLLEEKGLIEREDDRIDTRRTYLNLTTDAVKLLHEYFRKTRLVEPGLW